ncbi:hypothetical protein EDC26_102123 [Paralcaligenes ureilyticus]|uniref:Uncharacterized protein n=1 Tax=Paralcaligenes ureilyticus TaxID=627131 RepID=A0A4R3MDL2_9BURK|nr:hypothetical protein EDC26_102123 [Paralcaligenes ureilyticus]
MPLSLMKFICKGLVAMSLLLSGRSGSHLKFLSPQYPVADIRRTHFLELVFMISTLRSKVLLVGGAMTTH